AAEIRQVDAHLKRLRELEAGKAATAQPVKQAGNGNVAAVASAPVIRVEQKLDKGIGFARFAKSLAAAKGVRSEALEVARRQYPDDSRLHHVLKSAVGAGTTTDPQWAGSLSEYQEYAQDFIDYLRPQTIIGRFGQGGIPALRQVPFNIRVHAQVSGGAAGWVGEGKAKPLTKFDFESITFSHAKVSAIAVLTEELIRFSSPAADALVRNALAEAVVARLDTDFVDPKKAAVADVSPASITHDVKGTASTGNPDADAEAAFGQFVAATFSLRMKGKPVSFVVPLAFVKNLDKTLTVNTGALLTMSVSANGGTPPYKYAWKKDGQPVDGQTTDTFSKPGAQSADAGKYTCVVTDSAEKAQSVTSVECTVTVSAAAG
ncbi:phage major capsid protein, partial [Escherichia coli]|nr:phage major capsid protein [Escherichia coli]